MKYCYLVSFFLILLFSCKWSAQRNLGQICFDSGFNQPLENLSLMNIDQIKRLEGRFVEIDGIFHYRFEDVGLYPSKTAKVSAAMWVNLEIPDSVPSIDLRRLDQKKVSIIGRVNLKDKGHFNSYFGALDSVFCIKER